MGIRGNEELRREGQYRGMAFRDVKKRYLGGRDYLPIMNNNQHKSSKVIF